MAAMSVPSAMAKKDGREVRSEGPPSGKGSGVDDRQAKSDSGRSDSGRSGGGPIGSQGEGGGHAPGDENRSGASDRPIATAQPARVSISDDDRF
jgi:hypothetical protein